jgi:hypothetical protein
MTCRHDIIEMDNACADGMCPLCMCAEIARLRTDYTVLKIDYDALRAKNERLQRRIRIQEKLLGEANIAVPEH